VHPEIFQSPITEKEELLPGFFYLTIESPVLAKRSVPGQFVMVQVTNAKDPLLRRPFSLCSAADGKVGILFQVKGRGTAIMSGWEPGESINIMGPLGNGFGVHQSCPAAYLVAGGIGIAPLLFLSTFLVSADSGIAVKIFMGGRSAGEVSLLSRFDLSACDVFFATDDGSKGFHGLVTDLFDDYVTTDHGFLRGNSIIAGCGPLPMLQTLSRIASREESACQLSLEAHMACGVGACLGCVTATKQENGFSYKRTCVEGPVFSGSDIDWDHMQLPVCRSAALR